MSGVCVWPLFCYAELKCPFKFCNHLTKEERAGCFTFSSVLAALSLTMFCVSSSWCHELVCVCGISRSYLFFHTNLLFSILVAACPLIFLFGGTRTPGVSIWRYMIIFEGTHILELFFHS